MIGAWERKRKHDFPNLHKYETRRRTVNNKGIARHTNYLFSLVSRPGSSSRKSCQEPPALVGRTKDRSQDRLRRNRRCTNFGSPRQESPTPKPPRRFSRAAAQAAAHTAPPPKSTWKSTRADAGRLRESPSRAAAQAAAHTAPPPSRAAAQAAAHTAPPPKSTWKSTRADAGRLRESPSRAAAQAAAQPRRRQAELLPKLLHTPRRRRSRLGSRLGPTPDDSGSRQAELLPKLLHTPRRRQAELLPKLLHTPRRRRSRLGSRLGPTPDDSGSRQAELLPKLLHNRAAAKQSCCPSCCTHRAAAEVDLEVDSGRRRTTQGVAKQSCCPSCCTHRAAAKQSCCPSCCTHRVAAKQSCCPSCCTHRAAAKQSCCPSCCTHRGVIPLTPPPKSTWKSTRIVTTQGSRRCRTNARPLPLSRRHHRGRLGESTRADSSRH